MKKLKMTSGMYEFAVKLEMESAPESCQWLESKLPLQLNMIQGAWSGSTIFSDLDNMARDIPYEHATSYPIPSHILLYPGDEKGNSGEIYIPYGGNRFACPRGQLAGNHFLTIISGAEKLLEFGKKVRWEGAQELVFERI